MAEGGTVMKKMWKRFLTAAICCAFFGAQLGSERILATENESETVTEDDSLQDDGLAVEETEDNENNSVGEAQAQEESGHEDDLEEIQVDSVGRGSVSMSESEYNSKMNAFISDGRWCNGRAWGYYKEPEMVSRERSGIGCFAYACDFSKYMYGIDNYTDGEAYTDINAIRTGDVIRAPGHTFVVLSRNGNNLYTAEGNYGLTNPSVSIRNPGYQIIGESFYNPNSREYSTLEMGYHFVNVTQNNFKYSVDKVEGGRGTVHLVGWVFDDVNISKSIQIHAYIDGGPGSGAAGYAIDANVARTDVDAAYHCGAFHGFDYVIQGISSGNHVVQLFANDQYNGTSKKIGEYSVSVATPNVFKYGVEKVEGGRCSIRLAGWVFDDANISRSIQVHAYIDGGPGSGAEGYAIDANVARTDVDASYHCGAFHGFDYVIQGISSGNHVVQLFANDQYNSTNKKIGDFSVSVVAPPVMRDGEGAGQTVPDGDYQIQLAAYNGEWTLDVPGDTAAIRNGTNAAICKGFNRKYDVFTVKYLGNGYYNILHKGSGKCLDMGSSLKNGGNVYFYDNGGIGHLNQQWSISKDSDGWFRIRSRWSGLYLDGGGDNYNVHQWEGKESIANQKWKFLCSVKSVSLNQSAISLNVGETQALTATVLPDDASNKRVSWISANPAIATVDSMGKVVAVKKGKTTITVKTEDGGYTGTCAVTVTEKQSGMPNPTTNEKVTEIALSQAAVSIYTNENEQNAVTLTASVLPENASNKTLAWTCANPQIASLSVDESTGKATITAVSNGKTKVTVKATDGSAKTAVCDVTVSTKTEGISLYWASGKTLTEIGAVSLAEGKTGTLKVVQNPLGSSTVRMIWFSSDASVATVSQSGLVSAKSNGVATIEAVSEDGEYSATCTVTVYEPVTSIKLGKTALKIGEGDSALIPVTAVLPETATNQEIVWSSSNEDVATVSSEGMVTAKQLPTGKQTATATVTALAADGSGKSAKCTVTVGKAVSSLVIAPKSGGNQLAKGKTMSLVATFQPTNPLNKTLTWASSDENVAVVSKAGVVKGIGAGTATIRAVSEAGEKGASYTVRVYVPATGIKLNQSNIILGAGKSFSLQATTSPADASGSSITWTSSDESLVTVDGNGRVTANAIPQGKKSASAKITATLLSDGGIKKAATCSVTVKPEIGVTAVKLNKTSLKLGEGSVYTLSTSVLPVTADNTAIIWSTSDESVARVSQDGVVTAGTVPQGKKTATAKITATAADGSKKAASCTVTVGNAVTALAITNGNVRLAEKKTLTLKTVYNSGDKNTPVNTGLIWTSSNENIAKVSAKGVVTAVGNGTATITATSEESLATGSQKSASCMITSYVPVSKVALNRTSVSIGKGKTITLQASSILPANAADKTLVWSSSNSSIASVDNAGKVTANGVGTARITVTAADGSKKSASCTVKVLGRVSEISIAETRGGITKKADGSYTLSIKKGRTMTAKAVVSPSNAVDKTVSYRSSNPSIATVSASGQIKAVGNGTAVITVTSSDGGYKAKCTVTVE